MSTMTDTINAMNDAKEAGLPHVAEVIADLSQLNGVLAVAESRALYLSAYDIQTLAARCHANSAKWFPSNHRTQQAAITHCTLGLAGEAGEVANNVKKLYGYVDQEIPAGLRDKIIEECIDTLVYDLVLLDILQADIPEAIEAVVRKCVARWGEEAT